MKKLFINVLSLTFISLMFLSCEKQEEKSTVTIYIANAGDKLYSDHLVAEIGDLSKTFFTPESRNMSLNSCNENAANAAYFELVPGTYTYKVTGGGGKWSGTFSVKDSECKIIELSY